MPAAPAPLVRSGQQARINPPRSPVALRLDPTVLAAVDSLAERLNHPTRSALLSYLVVEGLKATEQRIATGP